MTINSEFNIAFARVMAEHNAPEGLEKKNCPGNYSVVSKPKFYLKEPEELGMAKHNKAIVLESKALIAARAEYSSAIQDRLNSFHA